MIQFPFKAYNVSQLSRSIRGRVIHRLRKFLIAVHLDRNTYWVSRNCSMKVFWFSRIMTDDRILILFGFGAFLFLEAYLSAFPLLGDWLYSGPQFFITSTSGICALTHGAKYLPSPQLSNVTNTTNETLGEVVPTMIRKCLCGWTRNWMTLSRKSYVQAKREKEAWGRTKHICHSPGYSQWGSGKFIPTYVSRLCQC